MKSLGPVLAFDHLVFRLGGILTLMASLTVVSVMPAAPGDHDGESP